MGVPYFLKYIYQTYKNCIIKDIQHVEYLLIDCNCILHEVTNNYSYNMNIDVDKIQDSIVSMIKLYQSKFDYKYCVICLDGIPPLSKYECQRRRRQESNDKFSILLTPGTSLMKSIDDVIAKEFSDDIVIPSSDVGEGELKIVNFIRNLKITSYCIITVDSDLIILSLISSTLYDCNNVYVYYMSKQSSVDVLLVRKEMEKRNIFNSLFELVIISGNDYIPNHIRTINLRDIEKVLSKQTKNEFQFDIDFFIEFIKKFRKNGSCKCNIYMVIDYFRLIKWFVSYYLSVDSFYKGVDFNSDIPCVNCMIKYREEYDKIDIKKIAVIDKDFYIRYIIPDYYHKEIDQ